MSAPPSLPFRPLRTRPVKLLILSFVLFVLPFTSSVAASGQTFSGTVTSAGPTSLGPWPSFGIFATPVGGTVSANIGLSEADFGTGTYGDGRGYNCVAGYSYSGSSGGSMSMKSGSGSAATAGVSGANFNDCNYTISFGPQDGSLGAGTLSDFNGTIVNVSLSVNLGCSLSGGGEPTLVNYTASAVGILPLTFPTSTTPYAMCYGSVSVSAVVLINGTFVGYRLDASLGSTTNGPNPTPPPTPPPTPTPNLPAPTFSPDSGTYLAPQTVAISDTVTAASIYYTVDGTQPTANSTLYAEPITITSTETVQAVAVASGYANSPVASATYTINPPLIAATPTFSPPAGTFTSPPSVTIADSTLGANIYYTLDGSAPSAASAQYLGPITVNSTDTISAIAVASGYSNSPVAAAQYTINPPMAPTPQFIDPVSSGFVIAYSEGKTINTFTDALSSGGTPVVGAAADGISQILIRIPATLIGQQVTLTLLDENGSEAAASVNGGVFALGSSVSTAASVLPVQAVMTPQGPMAFAIFVSPLDFARSPMDYASPNRSLSLSLSGDGMSASSTPLLLVRPPIFLVHGLWADPSSWQNFRSITVDPLFFGNLGSGVGYADYSGYVFEDITSTVPSYSWLGISYKVASIRQNTLGFAANANSVESQLKLTIANYATSLHVASTQADVVGHSMGGDMAKYVGLLPDFLPSSPYGTGFIHKLITIGTPHLGAQLATQLLEDTNACSRNVLGLGGMYSFQSVYYGNSADNGAVYDLRGKGDGTGLSTALANMHSLPEPFPMAYIATISGSSNWARLNSVHSDSSYIHRVCGSDVIASALTPNGWSTIFLPDSSDSVVSLNSQMNGDTSTSSSVVSSSIIHSQGLENLNFIGPAETDQDSTIDDAVVTLINEPTVSKNFHQKGVPQ